MKLASYSERMQAERDGALGWIVFDNPARHNAVSLDMWAALPRIMADLVADPAVRVIVLRGAGERAFVSGADISEFEKVRASPQETRAYDAVGEQAMSALAACPKPTVAMVHGYCIGGGLALAISCDLRLCAEGARFGVPAAKLGVGYGAGGVRKLMALVGPAFTEEIFYTGRQFSAQEALAMGLVNRVLAPEQLEGAVRELAGTVAANAPLTLGAVKATVAELHKDPALRELARSEALVAACFASADYVEGRRAFMEKRPPVFQGR
jgi:enoyl-CoA hydratase/carnithine racemase